MINNHSSLPLRKVAGWMLGSMVLLSQYGCSETKKAESEQAVVADSTATPAEVAAPDSNAEAFNILTEQEKKDGWILLFDGTSTDAWRGYTQDAFPTKGWLVKDGVLMVETTGTEEAGFGGDIITKEQYGNFEYKMDFKLSPEGNSGIVYLVKEEKGQPVWHNAPEYQLLDNAAYEKKAELPMDKHRTGDIYDIKASTVNAMKPVGEWNEAMVRVKDGQVEHWLNGQKVVEYTLWTPEWKALVKKSKFAGYPGYGMAKKGNIGIQDHGHQLWYRNIKVRPI